MPKTAGLFHRQKNCPDESEQAIILAHYDIGCHCEERSDVAISSGILEQPTIETAVPRHRGLPHQCAHWFAMTRYF